MCLLPTSSMLRLKSKATRTGLFSSLEAKAAAQADIFDLKFSN
jgi:hypothetical protein